MSWRGVVVGGGGGGAFGTWREATLPLFVRPSETVMSWVRRTVHKIACCRVREAECGRRRGLLQSAGGGAASSLPPTPPLPTLLLSQIRRI